MYISQKLSKKQTKTQHQILQKIYNFFSLLREDEIFLYQKEITSLYAMLFVLDVFPEKYKGDWCVQKSFWFFVFLL